MKKFLLLFAAILMASTGMWAQETQNVSYLYPVYNTEGDPASGIIEWKTASVDATVVQGSDSTVVLGAAGTETWYVVKQKNIIESSSYVRIDNGVDIKGTVHLILYGILSVETVENRPGINTEGATLVIYRQPASNGLLEVKCGDVSAPGEINGSAGIGGGPDASGGTVIINGGNVTVTSMSGGAGIGGGSCGNGGTVIINGSGTVKAKSPFYGAGIGGGRYGSGGTVIINGGFVTAEGNRYSAGIGGGNSSAEEGSKYNYPVYGGRVIINGGTVTAKGGGLYAVGIGAGGRNGIGANLTINGGNMTVQGDMYGTCIGGYRSDESAMTTITNGAIKFAGTSLNENNTIATRANISGGIFSYESQEEWLQDGCVVLQNEDTLTRNEYPWKVVHSGAWETVTYGDNIAVSPTFTSGTELPAGTQITFTAADRTASGYVFAGFYEESTFDTPITTGVSGQTYTVTVMDAPISVYTKYEPYQGSTTYIDENGVSHNIYAYAVTDVINNRVTWGEAGKETWYVVTGSDVTLAQGADCKGSVNLILADGAKLTARVRDEDKACIKVSGGGNSLAIYGQANQSGELVAEGIAGAGIGGESGEGNSDITINGGIVTAVSNFGAGIGGGCNGKGSHITINGGTVTASAYLGNGIGGGENGESEDIFVATNLIVKAGASEQSATVIENTGSDLATSLAGKQYVTITEPNFNITANQDPDHKTHYYSTFYSSEYAYKVPEGVTAYIGKVEDSTSEPNTSVLKLTRVADGIIPAGESVILRLTTENITATKQQFTLKATTTSATKSGTNELTGTDVAKTLSTNDYALSYGQYGVGFYNWSGRTIDAHKAYLTLPSAQLAPGRSFGMMFDDGTFTGIPATIIDQPQDDIIYNLQGQRVDESYKGLIIKNGQKVYNY